MRRLVQRTSTLAARGCGVAAIVVTLCGCPNPNAYTVPRTLDPGDIQFDVSDDAYVFSSRIARPATAATPASTTNAAGITPMLPSVGIRYGLTDNLDVGVRVQNFLSLAGDLKFQFLRGRVDLAVDPGVQAIYVFAQGTNADGTVDNEAAGVFYLNAPLLVGVNVDDAVTLVASPGVAFAVATSSVPDASHAEQAGATTGVLARLGLGVDIRTSDRFALHPEVTCMKGFASASTLICVGGLGLNIGAQPSYDDLAPASSR